MGRLFVYDENMADERAKITVGKMAAVSDIVAPEKEYMQYSGANELTVIPGAVIAVGENAVFRTEETTLTAANLDGASSFEHGADYYVYICDTGNDSQNEVYLISQNSTFPDGNEWDDTNTRSGLPCTGQSVTLREWHTWGTHYGGISIPRRVTGARACRPFMAARP